MNNLKIKDRLVSAFITVAVIMTTVSLVTQITLFVVFQLYSSALINYGFAQGDIGRAMSEFADSRSAMRGIIGYDDQDAIDTLLANHESYKESFTKEFDSLESAMVTAENKALYKDVQDKLTDYWQFEQEIISQGATTDREQCKIAQDKALGELAPMYNDIYADLTEIMEIKVDKGQSQSNLLSAVVIFLIVVIIVVIIGSIVFALSLGKNIAYSIATPLDELKIRLDTFAQGDLSSPFPTVETRDELAEMVATSTTMAATLQFIIHDVGTILDQMANSDFTVTSSEIGRASCRERV